MAQYGTFPEFQEVTHSGQNNGSGDTRALYMKLFAGEVLTMFRSECLSLPTTRVQTLKGGSAYKFPMHGFSKSAKYHKPGELVQAGGMNHVERTVTVDDVAAAVVFVSEHDMDLNHYDTRSHYSRELAYELASMIDKNVFRIIAKAAFITNFAEAEAHFGVGNVLADETFTDNITLRDTDGAGRMMTRGQQLVDAIYRSRTEFKKKNVPGIPVCMLPPAEYEHLTNAAGSLDNMAWADANFNGTDVGKDNAGPTGTGETGLRIAGIKIIETNNLPTQDESAGLIGQPEPLSVAEGGSGRTAAYRGNYTGLIGLIYTKDCAATVKVRDVELKRAPADLRLGEHIIAKMFVGHNVLRPACAIALMEPPALAA